MDPVGKASNMLEDTLQQDFEGGFILYEQSDIFLWTVLLLRARTLSNDLQLLASNQVAAGLVFVDFDSAKEDV